MLNLDVFEQVGPGMANKNNNDPLQKYGKYIQHREVLFRYILTKTKIKRQEEDPYGICRGFKMTGGMGFPTVVRFCRKVAQTYISNLLQGFYFSRVVPTSSILHLPHPPVPYIFGTCCAQASQYIR